MMRQLHMTLAGILLGAAVTAGAGTLDPAGYDEGLCERAQKFILNAGDAPPFNLRVLRGEGNGFHVIQMDVDAPTRTVVVAASMGRSRVDGVEMPAYVACKMVDRDRVNDVLGLALPGPARSCRDVNEATWQAALESLDEEQRRRFRESGRSLRFADDYQAVSGGEWLPVAPDEFIRPVPGTDAQAAALEIRAPSVRVAWNPAERNFFQGTQHCKLITISAMRRWLLAGAFSTDARLFPPAKLACTAPSSMTSAVGSCRFYFAPAGAVFCEDYSGRGWTEASARAVCGKRHASEQALRAAANRHAGAGGVFSQSSCKAREDVDKPGGTCVFNCQADDEALWHLSGPLPDAGPAGADMMSRACDLYIR